MQPANSPLAVKRLGMILTILAAVLANFFLTAAPARAAAYYSSTIVPGNNVRACASTACIWVATTTSTGRMQCWRDGGYAVGRYGSSRWFLMELNNAQEGYVHSSFVSYQTTVPHCSSLPRVVAADWALARVGQSDAPAPYNKWSGYCLAFVNMAYQSAGIYRLGAYSANEQWWALQAQQLTRTGIPRYGDPVFTSASGYGHVFIYVGGRTGLGTNGAEGANQPVGFYDMYTKYPSYRGWAKISTP